MEWSGVGDVCMCKIWERGGGQGRSHKERFCMTVNCYNAYSNFELACPRAPKISLRFLSGMLFTGSLAVSISAAVSVARCNDEDGHRYEAAYDLTAMMAM